MNLPIPKYSLKMHLLEAGYSSHPGRSVSSAHSFKPIRFPANVALIEHPTEGLYLFDTGYSENFREQTQRMPSAVYRWITPVTIDAQSTAAARIKTAGFRISDIRTVIFSHFHADHIGGAKDFIYSNFICDSLSLGQLNQQSPWKQLRHGFIASFLPRDIDSKITDYRTFKKQSLPFQGLEKSYDLFGDQTAYLVPLPGHAYGHIGLLVYVGGRWKFLVADAVWTHAAYRDFHLPSRLAQMIFLDRHEYKKTIRALHYISREKPELDIIPCHC